MGVIISGTMLAGIFPFFLVAVIASLPQLRLLTWLPVIGREADAPQDPPCPHRSRLNTPQGSQLHPGCSSQLVRLKLHLPPLPPTPGSGVSGFFRQKADVESRPNVGLNLAEGHHARKATLHTEVLYKLAVLLHRDRNYLQGLVAVIHSYCLVASRLVGAVFIILFRILLSA